MKAYALRIALVVAVSALAAEAAHGALSAKKTALITIPATLELKTTPAKVWEVVTSVEGFTALTGFKASGGRFSKIGDTVPGQAWEDKGRLVVTEFVPEKELRVTWEPVQGHYLCQKRIVLTPTPGGTRLEYWDRYTDDQPNADQTAKQVVAESEKLIEGFRKMVEK